MYNSKIKFLSLYDKQKYIRVSEEHPQDFFLGLSKLGEKVIQLVGFSEFSNALKSTYIDINQFLLEDKNYIQFILKNEEFSDVFYKFCDDLIESTRFIQDPNQAYKFVIKRFGLWKKMFLTSFNHLSENAVKGLLGELIFIKDFLSNKVGINDAIVSWSGPEKTNKDFSFDENWYEIKTVDSNSKTIKISSLDQLDSLNDGYLHVYILEKMSPKYKGIKLNSIVNEIFLMIKDSFISEMFSEKLFEYGYFKDEYYDQLVYKLNKNYVFLVNEKFPKLTRDSIVKNITKVSYEISLNSILEYKIKL